MIEITDIEKGYIKGSGLEREEASAVFREWLREYTLEVSKYIAEEIKLKFHVGERDSDNE